MKHNVVRAVLISFVVGWALVGLHTLVFALAGDVLGPFFPYLIDFVIGFLICFGVFRLGQPKCAPEVTWDELEEEITSRHLQVAERDSRIAERDSQLAERDTQLKEVTAEIKKQKRQRKRAEQELVQAQKLEGLGRLAGGIAHDVNNVLASIMSIASSIKLDLDAGNDRPATDDVCDILDACRRGRDLTLSLLGFARKGDFFKRPISVVKEIEEVRKLLLRVSPKTLAITLAIEKNIPQIEGDPSEIKNVLMNLCINGIDAMNGNGELTVGVKKVSLDESTEMLAAGQYVLLQVTDTGEGMTEETLRRAFEPFYTTKPEGKGTGLGLPRVWGIVKEHSGSVEIDSYSGVGTTFNVMLPALDEAREDPGIRGSKPPVQGQGHTVLLIDDEDLIRKAGTRILEKIGYNVIPAEHGKEAMEKFQKNPEAVDLVLLDMIMPIMDGPATFAAIRKIRPDIPVILCSGYSKDDSATELLKHGNVGFVQKPFSLGEISSRMAQIIKLQG